MLKEDGWVAFVGVCEITPLDVMLVSSEHRENNPGFRLGSAGQ